MGQFGRISGIERDELAVIGEAVLGDGGGNEAILRGPDADEAVEFGIARAELLVLADNAVGGGAADAETGGAEFLPGAGLGQVAAAFLDIDEAFGKGGRRTACHEVEGLEAPQTGSQIEAGGRFIRLFQRLVHIYSRKKKTAQS